MQFSGGIQVSKPKSNKSKFIISAIMPFVLLPLFAFQEVKEPEGKKNVQVQKAEVIQPVPETGDKVPPQVKQNVGQLTEEEQKSFEGCIEPGILTQEEALKSLRILVKGDSDTIRWYKKYEKEPNRTLRTDRRYLYQMDICSNVMILSKGKNKDAYSLILQIIEKKTEYSRTLECSIVAVSLYGEFKNGKWHGDKRSIPVLKKLVNDKDPKIRVQSAGALLSLGEGDLALPVLDELAKSGIPQSITALKRLFALEEREVNGIKRIVLSDTKLLDKRGEKILIKSLNYSSNEVKAFAAVRLAHMGIEKKRVEDTAITVLERLIDKKERGYKKAREWRSDKTAGYYAIAALEKIKSSAGINVLKKFLNNNYDASFQKRAKLALENILQK
jgi:hypothetical protein